MILRQAMCPFSPRDLSLELTYVYEAARKSGSCGNRIRFYATASSSAAADPGNRWLDDHEGHGERYLPVVVFVTEVVAETVTETEAVEMTVPSVE